MDLHGGPHGAWNPFFPEWDLYHQMLVQRGWMVLLPNISGSDGYGGGFRSAIHRVWGPAGQADVLTCLRDLVRDGSRLAVAGYSYGGFLACWLIAAMPELFRAAVVSSAITDLTAFQTTLISGRPSAGTSSAMALTVGIGWPRSRRCGMWTGSASPRSPCMVRPTS